MLGLRSSQADMRKKFFVQYNKVIPPSVFERLKFILCSQNWEHLASSFWLKEAIVRPHPLDDLPCCTKVLIA